MTGSIHDDETRPLLPPSATSYRQLYLFLFLSTWNSRVFAFSSVLFLASVYPSTFVPLSCYALVCSLAAILLGSSVGQYIDENERLKVVTISIVTRRTAVLASCVGFWVLICKTTSREVEFAIFAILVVLACVERLCSILDVIAVQRDWLVIIAGADANVLRVLNSRLRRIDLFCKLIGPLGISLTHSVSMKTAIIVVFVTNLISASVECAIIEKVFKSVPALRSPRPARAVHLVGNTSTSLLHRITSWLGHTKDNFIFYSKHPIFLPSFSESFLYFNVLAFSSQMIAYLMSIGYSSGKVGILRTISVLCELSATWIAPVVMRKIGPTRSGLWFVSWQSACLVIAVASLAGVLDFGMKMRLDMRDVGFVAAAIASRVGLWGFDLCVQTLIQENVEPENRGTFSAVESSVRGIFEVCAFLSTIVFSRPEGFIYPSLMSAAMVVAAGVLYATFVKSKRNSMYNLMI